MECIECVDHLHQVDDGADVAEGVLAVEIHTLSAHRADPLDLLGLIDVVLPLLARQQLRQNARIVEDDAVGEQP